MRRLEALLAKWVLSLCAALVAVSLLAIIVVIVEKGYAALSWAMVSQTPKGGFYLGKEGGLLNAIVGSFAIAGGATLLAFVFGLPIAFYLQKGYLGGRRLADLVRLVFDILFGIPSIVYGALGFALMLAVGLRASLLGGILAVAMLELPIIVRGMDETLRMIPDQLIEASLALGATRLETMLRVGLRQSLPGIVTAVIVAFGRGIGDAASVLFTAGFSDNIPDSLVAPAATLPLAIFFQLGSPIPEVQARAYAAAIILFGLILVLSVLARLLSARLSRSVVK